MYTNKVRTSIVGCGKVGQIHAKALAELPQSNFVAACDKNYSRAELFREKFGIEPFSDVESMVKKTGAQAAIICTPHPLHAPIAIEAMEAGVHVLVEKPMASTLLDCDVMIHASQVANVKLGVISQRRLYDPVLRVKKAIDNGKIGKPILAVVTMLGWRNKEYYDSDPWRGKWKTEGGGVLVNQAPHQLDLLQWFMGDIKELFGYWENLNHPYIEVEDTALAVIRFSNGGLGSIIVSNSQKPGLYGKVHIHGENGASLGVQTDGGAMFIAGVTDVLEPPINDLWTVPGEENLISEWQEQDLRTFQKIDPGYHYHKLQDQDFLNAILEDRDPLVTGKEGRKLVEIFTAIYRSNRSRSPIDFPLDSYDGFDDFDGRLYQKNGK